MVSLVVRGVHPCIRFQNAIHLEDVKICTNLVINDFINYIVLYKWIKYCGFSM